MSRLTVFGLVPKGDDQDGSLAYALRVLYPSSNHEADSEAALQKTDPSLIRLEKLRVKHWIFEHEKVRITSSFPRFRQCVVCLVAHGFRPQPLVNGYHIVRSMRRWR